MLFEGVSYYISKDIPPIQFEKLKNALNTHGGHREFCISGLVTHVISPFPEHSQFFEQYSHAQSLQLAIVVPDWVFESVKSGAVLPVWSYRFRPKLFKNYRFMISRDIPEEDRLKILSMVVFYGGACDFDPDKPPERLLQSCQALFAIRQDSLEAIEARKVSVPVVHPSWIIDCLKGFHFLSFDDYLLVDTFEENLTQPSPCTSELSSDTLEVCSQNLHSSSQKPPHSQETSLSSHSAPLSFLDSSATHRETSFQEASQDFHDDSISLEPDSSTVMPAVSMKESHFSMMDECLSNSATGFESDSSFYIPQRKMVSQETPDHGDSSSISDGNSDHSWETQDLSTDWELQLSEDCFLSPPRKPPSQSTFIGGPKGITDGEVEMLHDGPSPSYTRFLQGSVFYFENYPQEMIQVYHNLISLCGGSVLNHLSPETSSCTHLLTPLCTGSVYEQMAPCSHVTIGTIYWLKDIILQQTQFKPFHPLHFPLKCAPFENHTEQQLVITTSGFSGAHQDRVVAMIRLLGFCYDPFMTPQTTHLICLVSKDFPSPKIDLQAFFKDSSLLNTPGHFKIKKALEWNTVVANELWLRDMINLWKFSSPCKDIYQDLSLSISLPSPEPPTSLKSHSSQELPIETPCDPPIVMFYGYPNHGGMEEHHKCIRLLGGRTTLSPFDCTHMIISSSCSFLFQHVGHEIINAISSRKCFYFLNEQWMYHSFLNGKFLNENDPQYIFAASQPQLLISCPDFGRFGKLKKSHSDGPIMELSVKAPWKLFENIIFFLMPTLSPRRTNELGSMVLYAGGTFFTRCDDSFHKDFQFANKNGKAKKTLVLITSSNSQPPIENISQILSSSFEPLLSISRGTYFECMIPFSILHQTIDFEIFRYSPPHTELVK